MVEHVMHSLGNWIAIENKSASCLWCSFRSIKNAGKPLSLFKSCLNAAEMRQSFWIARIWFLYRPRTLLRRVQAHRGRGLAARSTCPRTQLRPAIQRAAPRWLIDTSQDEEPRNSKVPSSLTTPALSIPLTMPLIVPEHRPATSVTLCERFLPLPAEDRTQVCIRICRCQVASGEYDVSQIDGR
jgi:hypothetical protein